jgi:hypothetical protein
MKGPLYWLLVHDVEKTHDWRVIAAPSLWLYFVGNAVWGLACLSVGLEYPPLGDEPALKAVVRWLGLLLAMSLPTVFIRLWLMAAEGEEGGVIKQREVFHRWIVGVLIDPIPAFVLGLILERLLSFLGVHSFLGIGIV